RQSLRIIRQATEGLPEGPIVGKVPRLIKPPAGETYHTIESPKGELGYFIVSDGKSTNPYRFRVRPPSFCNLQGLRTLIRGHLVADVVALIGSLHVVLGEGDRCCRPFVVLGSSCVVRTHHERRPPNVEPRTSHLERRTTHVERRTTNDDDRSVCHPPAEDRDRVERDARRGHLHGAARAQGDRLGAIA